MKKRVPTDICLVQEYIGFGVQRSPFRFCHRISVIFVSDIKFFYCFFTIALFQFTRALWNIWELNDSPLMYFLLLITMYTLSAVETIFECENLQSNQVDVLLNRAVVCDTLAEKTCTFRRGHIFFALQLYETWSSGAWKTWGTLPHRSIVSSCEQYVEFMTDGSFLSTPVPKRQMAHTVFPLWFLFFLRGVNISMNLCNWHTLN